MARPWTTPRAPTFLLAAVLALAAGCQSHPLAALQGAGDPAPPVQTPAPSTGAAPSTPAAQKAETPAAATEPKRIDLRTALRLAAGGSLDVLDARARVREARGRASAADGYLLPVLSFGAAMGETHGLVQGSFGDLQNVEFGSASALGTVRLSMNVGEAIYRDLAARRSASSAADLEAASLQRTLLSIALGYLGLIEADATVRIQEQFLLEAQSLMRFTSAREAQGLGTTLDSERARAQAAAAEQRLIAARNDRQRRSKALAVQLRLDPAIDLEPVDRDLAPATLVDPAQPLSAWLATAAARRPELPALEEARGAAENEASASRWAAWGPEVSAAGLFGEFGHTFRDLDDRESWLVAVGWNLSFSGPGKIEASAARAEEAGIAVDRFRDGLQGTVAAAHRELALSIERLAPAERELASAESALRIARANFDGGLLPESDLLLAQQSADQARLRRLTAVVQHNQAQIRLLAEAGIASIDALSAEGAPKKLE